MEDLRNVARVCPDHAPIPDPRWLGYPPAWFIGKIVKVGFPTSPPPEDAPESARRHWPTLEHMWVKVLSETSEYPDHELLCELDNDPIYVLDQPCGSRVAIHRCEIEEVHGYGPGPRGSRVTA